MKSILVAALVGTCFASELPVNPLVGIEVRRDTGGYLFSFRNCINRAQTIDIRRITVSAGDEGKDGAVACQVSWKDHREPSIKQEWRYGSTPPGYSMSKCEPLVQGRTYVVRVSGAGGGGATFIVGKDGSVKITSQACE